MAESSQNSSSRVNVLHNQPPELRIKLYKASFWAAKTEKASRHVPSLLIALAGEKILYNEAKCEWSKMKGQMHLLLDMNRPPTLPTFHQCLQAKVCVMRIPELRELELRSALYRGYRDQHDTILFNHFNNFEVLVMDCFTGHQYGWTTESQEVAERQASYIMSAQRLIMASERNLKRLIIRLPADPPTSLINALENLLQGISRLTTMTHCFTALSEPHSYDTRSTIFERACLAFEVKAEKLRDGKEGPMEEWCWEREDGRYLGWDYELGDRE